jgi:small-conductance mechanosensitive channel
MATSLQTTGIDVEGVNNAGTLDPGTLIPQILEKFLAVLEGAAIIALGFFLIKYIRKTFQKIEIAHEQQRTAINLLEKITSGFLVVISITIALKIIGIDMTLLVSVMILGLSYGLQDIIKNYVAGILILFKAPFKIGETVKIRDYTGKVQKMDFQSTMLETFDHRTITIYNSDVMTQSIVNFSNNTLRRIEFDVMLGYGSDVPTALKIFDRILKNHPLVLKNPAYSIVFKKFSETSAVFTLKFWVQQPCNILKIRSEIALLISQSFDEEKIFMPYTKGIEANQDYTVNENRKQQIQNFQNQLAFTETTEATQEGQMTAELQPVLIDAEEPE